MSRFCPLWYTPKAGLFQYMPPWRTSSNIGGATLPEVFFCLRSVGFLGISISIFWIAFKYFTIALTWSFSVVGQTCFSDPCGTASVSGFRFFFSISPPPGHHVCSWPFSPSCLPSCLRSCSTCSSCLHPALCCWFCWLHVLLGRAWLPCQPSAHTYQSFWAPHPGQSCFQHPPDVHCTSTPHISIWPIPGACLPSRNPHTPLCQLPLPSFVSYSPSCAHLSDLLSLEFLFPSHDLCPVLAEPSLADLVLTHVLLTPACPKLKAEHETNRMLEITSEASTHVKYVVPHAQLNIPEPTHPHQWTSPPFPLGMPLVTMAFPGTDPGPDFPNSSVLPSSSL